MAAVKPKNSSAQFVTTKHYAFADFASGGANLDIPKAAIRQYMTMYARAKVKTAPTILELGTRKGISTTMFLQLVSEQGGHVYSVDIEDFSDVAEGNENWTFIQSDSTAIDAICARAAALKDGIDILLIDSLHKRSHVEKELIGWSKYLKQDAIIFFDDLDCNPYRTGHRKDSAQLEYDWQSMQDGVLDIFHNNEDDCTMEIHYGSTGLGIMTKATPMGTPLVMGPKIQKRTYSCIWNLYFAALRFKQKLMGHAY